MECTDERTCRVPDRPIIWVSQETLTEISGRILDGHALHTRPTSDSVHGAEKSCDREYEDDLHESH